MCYIDTDSFIVYIKTDYIYEDTPKDVESRFDTSNYELARQLPKGKNTKVTELMKDELDGNVSIKLAGLRVKRLFN